MKMLMMACSRRGYTLMHKLKEEWKQKDAGDEIYCKVKCSSMPEESINETVSQCVGTYFEIMDAIVFFSTTGIAVRSIAPYLKHTSKDPAIIVIDEMGKFCISLLSGHIGGANLLAAQISKMLGATAVITTATDCEGKFLVDSFAKNHNFQVSDWNIAKKISVAMLEGKSVGLCVNNQMYTEVSQKEELVSLLGPEMEQFPFDCLKEDASLGIHIFTNDMQFFDISSVRHPFEETLVLVPRRVVIGIGCRKNATCEMVAEAVEKCLKEMQIPFEQIELMASVDLKKEEEGILAYCEKTGLTFQTFSAEELQDVEGDFSRSDFVEQVVGVSNVCERSAVLASGGGPENLICHRRVYDGVTIALANKRDKRM